MAERPARLLLSDAQRLDWLRLIRSEGVGPRSFRTLINHYGSARAALDALPDIGARNGRPIRPCSIADAKAELAAAAAAGVRHVALGEPAYPFPLAQIADPPPLLGVRGADAILARPAVAIVGSRNASAAGLRMTESLARDIGRDGYAIVSGLARGVDARAHEASLETGTIAVLAGGHDRLYPAEHAPLVDRILAAGGAILSEMPMGWTPRGRDFPRRNRLVSGLALGVVVVEAARKSGSLITARFALEQGREVFAVPGSPLDPRAEGTNDLIRQGATLTAEAEHVTSALAPLLPPPGQAAYFARDESGRDRPAPLWDELDLSHLGGAASAPAAPGWEEPAAPAPAGAPDSRVRALLSVSPIDVDDLCRLAGLPVREVRGVLAELDLLGLIERHGANRISLRPDPGGR